MTAQFSELYSGAGRLFSMAVLLAASWMGLNLLLPDLWPTGIPTIATRFIIYGTILVGLWLGLSRTNFAGSTRVTL